MFYFRKCSIHANFHIHFLTFRNIRRSHKFLRLPHRLKHQSFKDRSSHVWITGSIFGALRMSYTGAAILFRGHIAYLFEKHGFCSDVKLLAKKYWKEMAACFLHFLPLFVTENSRPSRTKTLSSKHLSSWILQFFIASSATIVSRSRKTEITYEKRGPKFL